MTVTTIANVDMAKAWDGEEGDHWTEFADRYDACAARIWRRFLDAGLIGAGDRVLDVGCGGGQSTIDAALAATGGSALGVDLSGSLLALARRRSAAQGVPNVEFRQADAQVYPFDHQAFDLVISRFGAMFFADRAAAFANIAHGLRPGGRLAVLAWRSLSENPWLLEIRGALAAGRDLPVPPAGSPGPFGLADAAGATAVLAAAGFAEVSFDAVDEPMYFGADAADAWGFVEHIGIVKGLTETLDERARAQALARLQAVVAARATPAGVLLDTGAWLITARRR